MNKDIDYDYLPIIIRRSKKLMKIGYVALVAGGLGMILTLIIKHWVLAVLCLISVLLLVRAIEITKRNIATCEMLLKGK